MKKRTYTIEGIRYESMNAAARDLGVSPVTVRNRLQSPNYPGYVSKYHPKRKPWRASDLGCPCTVDGVRYESIKAAADALGLGDGTVQMRLRSSNYPGYVSEHHPKESRREYIRSKKPYKNRMCPCTINGIKYESIKVAAKALGLYTSGLRRRLASSNFPDYICKHIPKQKRRAVVLVPCVIKGVAYASIPIAAKKLGKGQGWIVRRLRSFDYPDYVCDEYPKDESIKFYKYEVRGKRYKTLKEIGNMEGVTKEYIRQKMNNPKFPDYQRL